MIHADPIEADKDRQAAAFLEQRLQDHVTLPEAVRFENALNIWVHDLRAQELDRVAAGGRLTVAALGYEEVLKLRGILGRFLVDRKRRIQGRWDRRRTRRLKAAKEYLDEHENDHLGAPKKSHVGYPIRRDGMCDDVACWCRT